MTFPVPMSAQAGDIINTVAAEVGLEPILDPYSSLDPSFKQLTYLLNTAGRELLIMFEWEQLQNEHAIATLATDSGDYPLPTDFAYMINQTGWERAQNIPLYGPLTPQDWQYLLGRDLVTSTIYASFRLKRGEFSIFPQPPPAGLDIHFEYIGKNWVQDGNTPEVYTDAAVRFGDTPVYNSLLISRYLKVKWLDAKSLDSNKAQDDFDQIYGTLTGLNMGAAVLNSGYGASGVPYINTWNNLADSGYGLG